MANRIRTGNLCEFNRVRSSVKVSDFNKYLKKAGGHIGQNVLEIRIKMKTIVWKPLMIKVYAYSFLGSFFVGEDLVFISI